MHQNKKRQTVHVKIQIWKRENAVTTKELSWPFYEWPRPSARMSSISMQLFLILVIRAIGSDSAWNQMKALSFTESSVGSRSDRSPQPPWTGTRSSRHDVVDWCGINGCSRRMSGSCELNSAARSCALTPISRPQPLRSGHMSGLVRSWKTGTRHGIFKCLFQDLEKSFKKKIISKSFGKLILIIFIFSFTQFYEKNKHLYKYLFFSSNDCVSFICVI